MGKQFKLRDERQFPPPEQMGAMQDRYVTHVETGTITKTHVAAHSLVARWKRAGRLSDTQIAAIALCEALWAKCGLRQKLTASYGERMPGGCDNEWLAASVIQAGKDLARIEGYCVPWQFEWFENVVRWGEAAGSAGASLGFNGSKGAQAATLMLVQCVADQIAKEERL